MGAPSTPPCLEAKRHVVYDIVYQPRETVLLREARAKRMPNSRGHRHAGAPRRRVFRTWFDRDPDTEAMFAALGEFGYG